MPKSNDKYSYAWYQQGLTSEHELLNRRLTWLLSSQTILFAALAFAMGNQTTLDRRHEFFFLVVSILGIAISLCILFGIWQGIRAKRQLWKDYKTHTEPKEELGVRTEITNKALVPDVLLPVFFTLAWISLLVFELVY